MVIELNNGREINIRVEKRNEDLYEYYINNTKIGVYQKGVMEDNILILQNTIENEIGNQIKDKIDYIDRDEILKEAEQNKEIEDYAIDELGIEKIKDILIVDIESKKGKELKEIEDKDKKLDKNEEQTEIEKTTTKDVNIKQEIKLNERADDMHDIRKWLGGKVPSEYTKIGIIESDEMDEMKDENGKSYKNNTTRFSLIIIDKNGNIEPLKKYIPELEQRNSTGNNPTDGKIQVNADGEVQHDAIDGGDFYIGNGKTLQIDNDFGDHVRLYMSKIARENTQTIGVQLRDENTTYPTDREIRDVNGYYEEDGEDSTGNGIKESETHKDGESLTYKDVDGVEESKSHLHIENIDNEKLEEIAGKWGMRDRDGKPDVERVKTKLEKEIGNKAITEQELENIVDDVTEELEEEYNGPNRSR